MTAHLWPMETWRVRNAFGLIMFEVSWCGRSVVAERLHRRGRDYGTACPRRRAFARVYRTPATARDRAGRIVAKLRAKYG